MSKQKIKWGSNTPDKKLAGNGFHANSAEFVPTPVDETDDADFVEYTEIKTARIWKNKAFFFTANRISSAQNKKKSFKVQNRSYSRQQIKTILHNAF